MCDAFGINHNPRDAKTRKEEPERCPADPEPRIEVDWTESQGPPVQEPTRRGQGTRFIERSIAYELKGKSSVTFEQEGLRATLTFPMESAVMPTGAARPPTVNTV